MNLTALFDLSLIARAERDAIEHETHGQLETLTFGDVEARANRMASELAARGLTQGDRLCVQLANGIDFIDIFLACVRLGVIVVPVNVLYRERELQHIIADSRPTAVVVASGGASQIRNGVTLWVVEDLAAAASHRAADRAVTPLDGSAPAVILYTSGTTGLAKGAVLSHDNLASNALTVVGSWHITETDRYLAMLPLFHAHGLANGLHAWLVSGCRMRLVERFDYKQASRLFTEFQPTLVFGVPTIYVRLLDAAVVSDDDAASIGATARLFVSGSAPLPAHVHSAFRQRFGQTILERYGMSETLMIAGNPYDGERRPGTVGMPFPGTSVRIVDANDATLPDGETGELQVKGPAVCREYWRDPAASEAAFTLDGWFRTGDLGVRSTDGYYTLRGRRGDLIISGGFNIYPREVEELLLENPGVREVAVVAAPDTVRGEVPVAYVVADPDLDVEELASHCREKLASFKAPRAFVRVESLPRTALGKIQKHLLPRLS